MYIGFIIILCSAYLKYGGLNFLLENSPEYAFKVPGNLDWNTIFIWGIIGMFLCVPFLIIVTIILSHFPQTRPIAVILSSDGRLRVPMNETMGVFSTNPSSSALSSRDQEKSEQGG